MNNNIIDFRFEDYREPIIEAFVQTYGEQYRDKITGRINDCRLIIYNNIDKLRAYYCQLKREKEHELSMIFLEKIGITIPEDIKYNYRRYEDGDNANIKKLVELYSDIEWFDDDFSDKLDPNIYDQGVMIERRVAFLKGMGLNVDFQSYNNYINTDEYKELRKKINYQLSLIKDINLEYEQYRKMVLEPYEQYIDQCNLVMLNIQNKKTYEFLSVVANILPEREKESILQNDATTVHMIKCKKLYTGEGVPLSNGYVDAFSSQSEKLLSDSDSPSETIRQIIND